MFELKQVLFGKLGVKYKQEAIYNDSNQR